MKKLLKSALIFICILGIAMTLPTEVSAKEQVEIHVGNAKGDKGERIEIPIKLENGENITAMEIIITYDSERLLYVSTEKEDALKKCVIFDANHRAEQSQINVACAAVDVLGRSGDMLTLEFEVIDDKKETYTLDVDVKSVIDTNMEKMSYHVIGGKEIEPSNSEESAKEYVTGGNSEKQKEQEEKWQKEAEEFFEQQEKENKPPKVYVTNEDGEVEDVSEEMKENAVLVKHEDSEETAAPFWIVEGAIFLAIIAVIIMLVVFKKRKGKKNENK